MSFLEQLADGRDRVPRGGERKHVRFDSPQ
jgi:hypothetical protein